MKYCIYCGSDMDDVAVYCPICGKRQESSVPRSNGYDSYYGNGNSNYSNVNSKNYHWAAVLALVFGILGGALAFVFGGIGLSKCDDPSDRKKCIVGMVLAGIWITIYVYLSMRGII